MKNLSEYTSTELLKISNDIKVSHETLKQELIVDTFSLQELEEKLNKKLVLLEELENNYVLVLEEINKK